MSTERAVSTPEMALPFLPLRTALLQLAVFSDSNSANNADRSSQLGYNVTVMDTHDIANTVHYFSLKSKQVTRSVLASKSFPVLHAFDYASTVRVLLNQTLKRNIPLAIFMDSRSIFESLVGINSTTEKRLLIKLAVLRQAYEMK